MNGDPRIDELMKRTSAALDSAEELSEAKRIEIHNRAWEAVSNALGLTMPEKVCEDGSRKAMFLANLRDVCKEVVGAASAIKDQAK